MRIITNPYVKAPLPHLSMVVGNFDGLHLGHRALLRRAVSRADEMRLVPAVFTFHPHPQAYFKPDSEFRQIFTRDEKIYLLGEAGIDLYIEYPFTSEFSEMDADVFAALLFDKLHCHCLVVGEDFRFGRGREGGAELLAKEAERRRLELSAMPALSEPESAGKISSSVIRGLIAEGELKKAAELLGGPYFIMLDETAVQNGGVTEFYPNRSKLLPPDGVYDGIVHSTHSANSEHSGHNDNRVHTPCEITVEGGLVRAVTREDCGVADRIEFSGNALA